MLEFQYDVRRGISVASSVCKAVGVEIEARRKHMVLSDEQRIKDSQTRAQSSKALPSRSVLVLPAPTEQFVCWTHQWRKALVAGSYMKVGA